MAWIFGLKGGIRLWCDRTSSFWHKKKLEGSLMHKKELES